MDFGIYRQIFLIEHFVICIVINVNNLVVEQLSRYGYCYYCNNCENTFETNGQTIYNKKTARKFAVYFFIQIW